MSVIPDEKIADEIQARASCLDRALSDEGAARTRAMEKSTERRRSPPRQGEDPYPHMMPSDGEIATAHREAAQLWAPAISVPIERFGDMISGAAVSAEDLRQWGTDLYLACAAGNGSRAAVRMIEERFIARLPARIRRLGAASENVGDILQTVRERLFSGEVPRIRAYNGSGPLEQWIKVVAIRTAIDLHRSEKAIPRTEAAWLETVARPDGDASALMMKVEYKREMEAAIRELVPQLSARDRSVLRLHVVEGVSIEKIAASYGVHRVTVARWVWTAGETLMDSLRARFREKFGIVPGEFDSLARLARSQLSVDLAGLLTG
jgi:RNA polymerase sigma-70 factor (ECF subfamily)